MSRADFSIFWPTHSYLDVCRCLEPRDVDDARGIRAHRRAADQKCGDSRNRHAEDDVERLPNLPVVRHVRLDGRHEELV